MAKIKIGIDFDIDFCVVATAEAFGFEGGVMVRRKRVAGQSIPRLSNGDILELGPEDYSDLIPERSTAPEQE
jgi:hypothetical protein